MLFRSSACRSARLGGWRNRGLCRAACRKRKACWRPKISKFGAPVNFFFFSGDVWVSQSLEACFGGMMARTEGWGVSYLQFFFILFGGECQFSFLSKKRI